MIPITVLIKGSDVPNLRLFFKEIVKELEFPHHTNNIQSFEEQINDLLGEEMYLGTIDLRGNKVDKKRDYSKKKKK